jgi:hypothetical protein
VRKVEHKLVEAMFVMRLGNLCCEVGIIYCHESAQTYKQHPKVLEKKKMLHGMALDIKDTKYLYYH